MMKTYSPRDTRILTLAMVLAAMLPSFHALAAMPVGDDPLTIDRIYSTGDFFGEGIWSRSLARRWWLHSAGAG